MTYLGTGQSAGAKRLASILARSAWRSARVNVHLNVYGQREAVHTVFQTHSLGKFIISGEVWHFSQPFEKGNTVGSLWAVSRALRKNLVVDAGFNRGLTKTSTRWEAFAGFTYLLPRRLWMARPGFRP